MEDDLQPIRERNARVEADKAWETSWTRRLVIAAGTYLIVGVYLCFLGIKGAWLHAAVPPAAFLLSTLTLSVLKSFWIKRIYSARC